MAAKKLSPDEACEGLCSSEFADFVKGKLEGGATAAGSIEDEGEAAGVELASGLALAIDWKKLLDMLGPLFLEWLKNRGK